jgi:hypothetical protein
MKNPRPRVQIPALMMGYIIGGDPGTRGIRRKKVDLSWNGSLSPTIQGRMKKLEYTRLPRGVSGRVPESPIALLSGRRGALMRSGGSHPSPRRGSSLTMLLKSRGMREVPVSPH